MPHAICLVAANDPIVEAICPPGIAWRWTQHSTGLQCIRHDRPVRTMGIQYHKFHDKPTAHKLWTN